MLEEVYLGYLRVIRERLQTIMAEPLSTAALLDLWSEIEAMETELETRIANDRLNLG